MKRLRSIAWNGLAATSALLCVATILLWVRSYWIADGFGFGAGRHIGSQQGRLWIETLIDVEHAYTWRPGFYAFHLTSEDAIDELDFTSKPDRGGAVWGFGCVVGTHHVRSHDPAPGMDGLWDLAPVNIVFVPAWALVVLTMALPLKVLLPLWRPPSRHASGHCASCGYDLRATPNRCPECATVPPAKPTGTA
jgi:hypothetical protein